ncbi:MAG: HAMP domain-containing histidine kinase, partial [Spirochaetes bacterium]|nr:HAMP domain-containing histidine kinase [Spirochaetota bacterium]
LIMVIGLIGLIIFLSVKKTLKPLDRIMEAAGRIGRGDLSYRIQHDRNDDFGKVADTFNTMARKLSAMLSNQRELLHFISHELRTPLARINLALEIKDKDKSAQLIKNEIHEIDTLVGQVLDLSRMDYEDQIKKNESIDLVAVLNKIIKKYAGRDIHFNPDAADTEITGSEVLIQKAFSNLIDNAVKYSPEGGVVDIGLRQEDDKYKITIENRGPGLSEKEVDKIWEPFYRGENSRVNNIDGKGLGLVIVKKAIKLSSGDVQVKSSTDGPTVFTVTLPRKTNVSDYANSLIK